MLDDVRVLEVSAPETMLSGRILADLGADVVVVEPAAGSPGRRLAPFLDDKPGLERSLTWHALNYNKRGITLELSTPDGKALMRPIQIGPPADEVTIVTAGVNAGDRVVTEGVYKLQPGVTVAITPPTTHAASIPNAAP